MENLVKRLEKKGWRKKEIVRAVGIIRNAKQNKPHDIKFLEERIYWVLLAVIIAANFAISIALIPVLIALNGAFLYLVLMVLGIVFGLLFELVIRSIEHLEKKHHLLLAVLIPLIALANAFVISNVSNDLMSTLSVCAEDRILRKRIVIFNCRHCLLLGSARIDSIIIKVLR
ncbi:hypothetical protein J4204_01850 [Candidatus Woesearchaeota archaeon]|nr:hypothetical protein [Candidatus Woesearchaeota archaeon]